MTVGGGAFSALWLVHFWIWLPMERKVFGSYLPLINGLTFSCIDRRDRLITNSDNWARLSSLAVETGKCEFLIHITLNNSSWIPCEDDVIFIHDMINCVSSHWATNSWYTSKGNMGCCVCSSTGWVSQCNVGVEWCVEVKSVEINSHVILTARDNCTFVYKGKISQ